VKIAVDAPMSPKMVSVKKLNDDGRLDGVNKPTGSHVPIHRPIPALNKTMSVIGGFQR